jgi:hypothetical protein
MNERPGFLAMLADEDRNAGAPPRVERALRARVQARRRPAWWTQPGWPIWAAAAAMAAVVLLASAASMRLWWVSKTEVAALPPVERFAPEVPSFALDTAVTPAPASTGMLTSAAARPARYRETTPSSSGAAPVRFYALAYAPPELLANGRVVRVRVPRSALLAFGLPLNVYRPAEGKVDADVIYTEDGIARAIRFVPTTSNY